jgi:hypothetical protein
VEALVGGHEALRVHNPVAMVKVPDHQQTEEEALHEVALRDRVARPLHLVLLGDEPLAGSLL